MISSGTPEFWTLYAALPERIRLRAQAAYRRWQQNPNHPGLNFERLQVALPVYSARINRQYRALCVRQGDRWIWFWIGTHAEYERVIAGL